MKVRQVAVSLSVAFILLFGAVLTVRAANEWFVLSEKALKATDPSTEIKIDAGRWKKDVKQMKFSVVGGDVELTKVVLHWDNRPDDTLTDLGVVKAGGETGPKEAPGIKARLKKVTVQYKILSGPTATLKVWGYD